MALSPAAYARLAPGEQVQYVRFYRGQAAQPFSIELRRSLPPLASISRCADLVLNRESTIVKRGDRRIELTQREFALLENLMRIPDVPVSRAHLLKEIWGATCDPSTNVVDVYMKYVRDKVDLPGLPKLVRTVRGTGYMVSAA